MSFNRTLIINCGASHVSASIFSGKGTSLCLEEFATRPLAFDFSIEEDWLSTLKYELKQLLARYKFNGDANLIAPSYHLLARSIKIPLVDAAERAEIIAVQAEQNIPYPLHEVVWDSQVIADDGVETEVTLIAVKSEVVNHLCGQMCVQGLAPKSVQAATILDYNAYLHACAADAEDTLLINIGARSTNLLFINQSGFFVRNIILSGNTLTQSIADSLGKTFLQAEAVKVGYFSADPLLELDESQRETIDRCVLAFFKKLDHEIKLSIVNFKRHRGAPPPARILLTGKGARIPSIVAYLVESQSLPVEYFNPLRNVTFGKAARQELIEENMDNLSEIIGEAYRLLQPAKGASIDLLPKALAHRLSFEKRKIFFVASAALLALATVPPVFYFRQASTAYREQVSVFRAQIAPLDQLQNEIKQYQQQADVLFKQFSDLETLVDSKSNWSYFLSDLQTRLQSLKDVWLDELKLEGTAEKRLKLSGRLLIKDYNPDNPRESSENAFLRVNNLLNSFAESRFISKVTSQNFYEKENPRILRFDFVLVPNPKNPL